MSNYLEKELTKTYALLLIDAQAKIVNPIKNKESIIKNIKKILNAYQILEKYIYISEQNPTKLGPTIKELLPKKKCNIIKKMDFSFAKSHLLINDLKNKGVNNLIICGFETHICIQQSVLDFINQKFIINVIADATGSRSLLDHEISLKRMISEGATVATTESIIFELCKTSNRKEFKEISNIIKN